MTHLEWGYKIWMEMWLGGMAAGAFFSAFLFERFSGDNSKRLLRLATLVSIPLVAVTLLLALLDLGKPLWFWHLFYYPPNGFTFRPVSPLWIGVWVLQIFVGLNTIMAILYLVESRKGEGESGSLRRVIGILSWINVVVAGVLMSYTGTLIASTNNQLWTAGPLLPPIFVATGVVSGLALLIVIALAYRGSWKVQSQIADRLAGAIPIVVVILLVLLGAQFYLVNGSDMEGAALQLQVLYKGSLAIPFWAMVGAFLVSIVTLITTRGKEIEAKAIRNSILLSSVSLLAASLVLRAVIVVGGQV